MRRRRNRNPLLMRIIGISILVHIIALPVLAHFGAFKKIEKQFLETRMVVLPPPPLPEKEKPEVKKTQQAKKSAPSAKKSASSAPHTPHTAQKSNLSQPKVVADARGGAGGDDSGPTVDANGSGKAGEIPTTKAAPKPQPEANANPEPAKKEATTPRPAEPKPEPAPMPKPAPVPEPKKPEPEPKKEPVFVEATPTLSPQPTIPDDLRADALDKTFVAEFVVSPEGVPSDIKVAQSTGNDELDRLALDTARQWRFKPATRDGQPIESRIRLHIEFQVN